jgi:hypothetical protein
MPTIAMLGSMGRHLAEVFGRRLHKTEILPAATHRNCSHEDRNPGYTNLFKPLLWLIETVRCHRQLQGCMT